MQMDLVPLGIAPLQPANAVSVRLRIWDSTGTKQVDPPVQPRVDIGGGAYAEPRALVDAIRQQAGFEAALLRVVAADCVEVEWRDSRPLPPEWSWRSESMTPPVTARRPWERPGWIAHTMSIVDRELTRVGRLRTGPPGQMRHTSVTGMLRIPTDGHPVWLKAVPPLFAHEAAVIRLITDLSTAMVPVVLAASDEWWLSDEFPAPANSPAGDPLTSLARLQIATASRLDDLRASGCSDRSIETLVNGISQLMARTDVLDSHRQRRLGAVLPQFEKTCVELAALGFPATLVHGDVSPGNVRWVGDAWLIYDWTDACIAHPFIDLASPLSYERDQAVVAERTRAYASAWAEVMPPFAVDQALATASSVGAAHQAMTYVSMIDVVDRTAGDQASGERLATFAAYWVDRLLASLGK